MPILSRFRPYFSIIGGFLIHFSIGNYYYSGNIQSTIIEYMQNKSLSHDSVRCNDTVWIVGLIIFGVGSSVCAGGFLAKKIGSSLTVLIGCWIMSANVILAYFTIKSYIFIMGLSYGLLAGIGAGLAYGVSLEAPLKWFPENKGLVIGVVISGFGLSPTVFDIIQNEFILTEENYMDSLPLSFVILGCCYVVLQGIGALLLREKLDIKMPKTKQKVKETNSAIEDRSELYRLLFSKSAIKPHQLLYEYDFWILWLVMLFSGSSIPIFISLHKEFGFWMFSSYSELYWNIFNVIGGISNALGRIIGGYVAEKKRHKPIMITMCLINALFMGTFYCLIFIPINVRLVVFGIWIIIINVIHGATFSVYPTMCVHLFGLKNFACNYGLLYTSRSVIGVIVSIVSISLESQIHYNTLCLLFFSIGCVMSIIGALFAMLFRGQSLNITL